jgi:hypothetical protein
MIRKLTEIESKEPTFLEYYFYKNLKDVNINDDGKVRSIRLHWLIAFAIVAFSTLYEFNNFNFNMDLVHWLKLSGFSLLFVLTYYCAYKKKGTKLLRFIVNLMPLNILFTVIGIGIMPEKRMYLIILLILYGYTFPCYLNLYRLNCSFKKMLMT